MSSFFYERGGRLAQDDLRGVNTSLGLVIRQACLGDKISQVWSCLSLHIPLGEAAGSERFLPVWHRLVGLWHDPFPGTVSLRQEGRKTNASPPHSGERSVYL